VLFIFIYFRVKLDTFAPIIFNIRDRHLASVYFYSKSIIIIIFVVLLMYASTKQADASSDSSENMGEQQ